TGYSSAASDWYKRQQYTRGNQTRAALMMGINRGTLRKKLKKYGMN
ncbi:hypothetical protein N2S64_21545, partial [Escherichia coli]|nr:hypothetical protein [Escherichia coli]